MLLALFSLLFFYFGRYYQYIAEDTKPVNASLGNEVHITKKIIHSESLATESSKNDERCFVYKETDNNKEKLEQNITQLAEMKVNLVQEVSIKIESSLSATILAENLQLLRTITNENLTILQIEKIVSLLPHSASTSTELNLLNELAGKMSEEYLPYLEASFYSSDDDVLEEAFLRLEELGNTQTTQNYLDWFAVHPTNEFVRTQAKKILSN